MRGRSRELVAHARWGRGVLRMRVRGEALEVEASNAYFLFEPRTIVAEVGYSSRLEIEDERKRRVVVEFSEELKPLEAERVNIVGGGYLGLFEVRITDLDFERYLTIVTPGGHLYDYAIITSTKLYVESSVKRKFFFEEQPFTKIVMYLM